MKRQFLFLSVLLIACACATAPVTQPAAAPATVTAAPPAPVHEPVPAPATPQPMMSEFLAGIQPAVASDVAARLDQFPRTTIDYDRSLLNDNERQVVNLLIDASKLIDEVFFRQAAAENPRMREVMAKAAGKSALHRDAYEYFKMMQGRWDRVKGFEPFVAPFDESGQRPAGAGFYDVSISKADFENWVKAHPKDKDAFEGLFTVVHRKGDSLVAVPYSQEYRPLLEQAAAKLREAAALTADHSLKDFLEKRAKAFLTDDYYESDLAWMDLSGPIEIVIGPYEVYQDTMFNYKASFESFVTVVDKPESEKLVVYASHLPDMERNLPIPDVHKNPNRGTSSPIKVVQELFTAGDARAGVQTSAFNLPNDEKVREAKGSKKVLLKNVMEAKYRQSGLPIAKRLATPEQADLISFDAYFNHTLFHELSHGLGPGIITVKGKRVDGRLLLKNLYSSIEECKADVLGVWNLVYAINNKLLTSFNREQLYVTNAALMFRSMRFGLDEAHGRGTAVQWNWYRERGAIVPAENGRFRVDMDKMDEATKSLANELLMIEATGDYERAKRLLDKYGVSTPEIEYTVAKLTDIPVDINPVYVAAGEGK